MLSEGTGIGTRISVTIAPVDPLTHTLTGLAMSEAGLYRAGRLATPTLVVGANLPDIDVFALFAGSDVGLLHRRGLSHGPLGIVLLPIALTIVMVWLDRRRRRTAADPPPMSVPMLLGLAYAGTLSHPLLDWLNTYGVRWLMPFDERWSYGDALFIVDPWVWLILGAACSLGRWSRGIRDGRRWTVLVLLASLVVLLGPSDGGARVARSLWVLGVAAVMAARRPGLAPARGRFLATIGLLAVAIYGGAMAFGSARVAERVAVGLRAQGERVTRVMAGPLPFLPHRRVIVAEIETGYRTGGFDLFREPRIQLDPRRVPKPADPAAEVALRHPSVRGFSNWVRFPAASIDRKGDATTVYLMDLRYIDRPTRGFGGAVVELPAGE